MNKYLPSQQIGILRKDPFIYLFKELDVFSYIHPPTKEEMQIEIIK